MRIHLLKSRHIPNIKERILAFVENKTVNEIILKEKDNINADDLSAVSEPHLSVSIISESVSIISESHSSSSVSNVCVPWDYTKESLEKKKRSELSLYMFTDKITLNEQEKIKCL